MCMIPLYSIWWIYIYIYNILMSSWNHRKIYENELVGGSAKIRTRQCSVYYSSSSPREQSWYIESSPMIGSLSVSTGWSYRRDVVQSIQQKLLAKYSYTPIGIMYLAEIKVFTYSRSRSRLLELWQSLI